MCRKSAFTENNLLNLAITTATLLYFSPIAESNTRINCSGNANSCEINKTCEFFCDYSCCKLIRNAAVIGSNTYTSNSSVCRSALHDLRISLHDSNKRKVVIKRFEKSDCLLDSSVRFGFASYRFKDESCSLFEFISPRISENILDVVSMHSDYLYGPSQVHTQVCVAASNSIESVDFKIYSKWENCDSAGKQGTKYDKSVQFEQAWYNVKDAVGYQCIPSKTDLSIITSIAFSRDAAFFPKSLSITVSKHENVTLIMSEAQNQTKSIKTVWSKDNEILNIGSRTQLSLTNVHESSSGIYGLKSEGSTFAKSGFVQLIVRACPNGKFGDNCNKTCPLCSNGGICHDITGECICSPGFRGTNCDEACTPGYVGKTCDIKCTGQISTREEELCKGLSVCLPRPYGCSCASGFTGLKCDEACSDGFYGAGCKLQHQHKHYKKGSCSKFSHRCECLSGWHGDYCDESYPALSKALSVTDITETSISLLFHEWSGITDLDAGVPVAYEVVYKEIPKSNWTKWTILPIKDTGEPYEVTINNLKSGTNYSFAVIVVENNNNKQETGLKVAFASTKCKIPISAPLLYFNQQEMYNRIPPAVKVFVRWEQSSKEFWNCQEIDTSIRIVDFNTDRRLDCHMQNSTSCYFVAYPHETWRIEVCMQSSRNCRGHSKYTIDGPLSVLPTPPIEMEVIMDPTSISLVWKLLPFSTSYRISYKGVDTDAVGSTQIQSSHAICTRNKEKYQCHTIQNLLPGYSYKIEIVAFFINTAKGRVMKIFTVYLEKDNVPFPVALGILIPLLLIIFVIIFTFFRKIRDKRRSSLAAKFLPGKIERDFGTSNEGLHEMEIIESDSMCEEISNPIKVDELLEFVKEGLRNAKIRKEFMSVPTGQLYACNAAKFEENKTKNRYGNILPYDHSRVVLDMLSGDPFSDYIHASYIHSYNSVNKYIATQGPLFNTISDFWRMVWNEGSWKILMVTNFVENTKCKCEKYWTDTYCIYEDIKITFEDSISYADYIIRTFEISKGETSRKVKQFHFTTWPDHGTPINTTPFIKYLQRAHAYKTDSEAPIIVHCSAGIGRTGATILLDSMINMGFQEKKVDVISHFCSMRKQRMNIVENYDQYVFVYRALVEIFCFEDTTVKYSDFKKEFENLKDIDKITEITSIEKQFKALSSLNLEPMSNDIQVAYAEENQSKNRSMFILPLDRGRPVLLRDLPQSDYINAVYVDGFSRKNAFIATQYPLPDTVCDFWTMVYEQKSKTVVLLQEMDFTNKRIPHLWCPGGILTFGELEVKYKSISSENEITIVNVCLCMSEKLDHQEPISVNIILAKNWAHDSNLPMGAADLLSTVTKVLSLSSGSNSIITSVCLDGATACGVFCASLYICDQIKTEGIVDIFHAVKCIRSHRPQFISNLAQYEFLFEVTCLLTSESRKRRR